MPTVANNVGNNLAELLPEQLPAGSKKEGTDWFAVFNPAVPRMLDVNLMHTLDHSSVVCCVRFSQDGKYIATGCNRSAQIFEVETGQKVSVLQDESVDRDGDLYIRSVCFSPDGRYLATGAEDKQIRVSDIPCLAALGTILVVLTISRFGISKAVLLDTHSTATSKTFTRSTLLATEDTLHLAVVTGLYECGISSQDRMCSL